ncbi:MAG: cell division protein FtsH [Chloroflexota bacterium]|nr:cell division protein FtsH [Chloroflexota bacterium]
MPNRPFTPQQYQYGTTSGYYPYQEDSMTSMFSMMMPMIMMVMMLGIMMPMLKGITQTS